MSKQTHRATIPAVLTLALLSAVLLAACTAYIPPPEHSDDPIPEPDPASEDFITQSGYASLEVGGSLSSSDVESYFGLQLFLAPQTETCSLGANEEAGLAVALTPELATMAFVFENSSVRTAEGIGTGSTYEDVFREYGDHVVQDYRYVSHTGGPQILVEDLRQPAGAAQTGETRFYVFETDPDGTVTRVRAGMWPWVGYLDYCSEEADKPESTGWPLTR